MKSKRDCETWLDSQYPLTISRDRYHGVYSGGLWLAFPRHLDEIPHGPWYSDTECMDFWDHYAQPVGKGNTPEDAIWQLKQEVKKLRRTLK